MPNAQLSQYDIHQGYRVPDGVLVEFALKGDQCAFENLVHRYRRPLLILIRGFLKDGDQVYDVLQHVFLKLFVSLPVLLTHVSLKPWLFQVARNRCVDELRRRHRQAEFLSPLLSGSTGKRNCHQWSPSPTPNLYRRRLPKGSTCKVLCSGPSLYFPRNYARSYICTVSGN